jgi:hypothetical protein
VDLNPRCRAEPALRGASARCHGSARAFADDGRQYLKLTHESYDFATMEPPPPLMPGISRLYSAEYYAALKERLNPGALVSQWLPESQMPAEAVDLVVHTFVDAFPHALLFVGASRELILVGSLSPLRLSRLRNLCRRLRRPSAAISRVSALRGRGTSTRRCSAPGPASIGRDR